MRTFLLLADVPFRFALVIETLCRTIAARAGRDRAVAPMVLLAWPYLTRLARRFAALVQRVRAGERSVRPPRPRTGAASRPGKPRLPSGFAWLIRLAPEAAPLGGQLQALLAEPELSALLAADPRAGRLLRPLCHMLGLRPSPDLPPALFSRPARPRSPSPDTTHTNAAPSPAPHTTHTGAAPSPAPDGPVPQAPEPEPPWRPGRLAIAPA